MANGDGVSIENQRRAAERGALPDTFGDALTERHPIGTADKLARYEEALREANARERPAFMAGIAAADAVPYYESIDKEQAWQQYRCQDDSDWKTVEALKE